jgi:hypothetical protein
LNLYRYGVGLFAVVFVGIGIALMAVTAARGGGPAGYVMGVLFVGLGAGRIYLLRSRR